MADTERTRYPTHAQWVTREEKLRSAINSLGNKSAPLIVNTSYISPINAERTDLPWSLGSINHPWRNVYICNCSNADLSPTRTEVIDVYTKLADTYSKAETNAKIDEKIEEAKKGGIITEEYYFSEDKWEGTESTGYTLNTDKSGITLTVFKYNTDTEGYDSLADVTISISKAKKIILKSSYAFSGKLYIFGTKENTD